MTRVFPRPPPSAPSRAWPGAAEARNPPLPPYAGELRDRLTEAIAGEVGFGGGDRAMYAYDASVYRQVPVGVVTPRDAADVEAALEVCRRFGAPVLARGCGTSLTGQAVNGAVVFDFTRHMDGIVELAPMRHTARVQPGVVCDRLRDAAAPYGLTFGPDPATHDHATIGGMVGNNSCGTHSLTAGKTVDNIEELEIVTYDGTRMRVGATGEDELECVIAAGGRRGAIYAGLRHIRDTYADAIRRGLPVIPRRVSGYNLDALLPENGFHVARALVGSEGTLALTLDATCGPPGWSGPCGPARTARAAGSTTTRPTRPRCGRSGATRRAPPACPSGSAATAAGPTGRTPPSTRTSSGPTCAISCACSTGTATTPSSTATGARDASTAASTSTCAASAASMPSGGSWSRPPTSSSRTADRCRGSTGTGTGGPSCGRACSRPS